MFTLRLRYALAAFAVLFGVAGTLLRGKILYATLLALGLFLVRTILAAKADADRESREVQEADLGSER